ncbi:hypothetical protein [Citrobacter werkmanii]|uniref:hypothetical protein n=1 Tax=Citrobacter werkmanii TaxID=67827 RepID=UPI00300C8522
MSTKIIELTNAAWTLAYTGPTTVPLAAEKQSGGATVWLAVGTAVPAYTGTGHYLQDGRIKNIELDAGENLYAWCEQGSVGVRPANLILTD